MRHLARLLAISVILLATGQAAAAVYVLPGTSPSIAILPDGGYAVAFQGTNNHLYIYRSTGQLRVTGLPMASGTSPAIAPGLSDGYEIAFQGPDRKLHLYSSTSVHTVTSQTMASGTSPAITTMSNGAWKVAFQTGATNLAILDVSSGMTTATTIGMMPGTSPSIAALSGSAFEVAVQANTSELWLFHSTSGPFNTHMGMLSTTSPAVTALSAGAFVVAIQANTTELWLWRSVGGPLNSYLGMLSGTSPSIAKNGSGYKVAFQANTGQLFLYDGSASVNTLQGLSPGTSPSIASWAGGHEIAYQANTSLAYIYNTGGSVTGTNTKYWYYADGLGNTHTATDSLVPGTFVQSTPGPGYLLEHLANTPSGATWRWTPGDWMYTTDSGTNDVWRNPDSTDRGNDTGYTVPAPYYHEYQVRHSVWDAFEQMGNQSFGGEISVGFYLSPSVPWPLESDHAYNSQHTVYMGDTRALRPWSSAFGTTPGPALNLATYEQVKLVGSGGNAGFLCVWVNDTSTDPSLDIEFCAYKWRTNRMDCPDWTAGVSCVVNTQITDQNGYHPAEYVQPNGCNFKVSTLIGPSTQLSTAIPGTITTTQKAAGPRMFYGLQITQENLSRMIAWANRYLTAYQLVGTDCGGGRKWRLLSTQLDHYSSGSLENGQEGAPGVAWNNDSLRAWTSY